MIQFRTRCLWLRWWRRPCSAGVGAGDVEGALRFLGPPPPPVVLLFSASTYRCAAAAAVRPWWCT
uniref:Uncharacterized protein n=1 Tax=Arundo donax TaxID=35708 RepID=A0A0A9BPC7_ARUDO